MRLQPKVILTVCRAIVYPAWRDRVLTPVTTMRLFRLQMLHGNTACSHLPQLSGLPCTAAASCQARARLPIRLVALLVERFSSAEQRSTLDEGRWHGHRSFSSRAREARRLIRLTSRTRSAHRRSGVTAGADPGPAQPDYVAELLAPVARSTARSAGQCDRLARLAHPPPSPRRPPVDTRLSQHIQQHIVRLAKAHSFTARAGPDRPRVPPRASRLPRHPASARPASALSGYPAVPSRGGAARGASDLASSSAACPPGGIKHPCTALSVGPGA